MVMESDSIWYSSLSTGIFEVDIQHSNIDQLIVLLERAKGEARIKESMDILIRAIENHFKYEEWRFGDKSKKMNQEHIDEHRRILRKYHDIANIVHDSNANDIKKEIVGMIKIVLMSHVKDFDCIFFQEAS
jgi:hemerythrin-like metal-binding protein